MSLSEVGSQAITAVPLTKALPSAASGHHFSAVLAAIFGLCDPLSVPGYDARPTGGRAGRPRSVRQDTVHWGGGSKHTEQQIKESNE